MGAQVVILRRLQCASSALLPTVMSSHSLTFISANVSDTGVLGSTLSSSSSSSSSNAYYGIVANRNSRFRPPSTIAHGALLWRSTLVHRSDCSGHPTVSPL
eukprot:GHUV01020697.1.p1 GENE.GHUV01020697.1~~GHUV01020697.1.p1  ORF type:complete len:101 (-),score=23.92 GHUV01020697.1:211-513(-)